MGPTDVCPPTRRQVCISRTADKRALNLIQKWNEMYIPQEMQNQFVTWSEPPDLWPISCDGVWGTLVQTIWITAESWLQQPIPEAW
jgi:hypothetical protein